MQEQAPAVLSIRPLAAGVSWADADSESSGPEQGVTECAAAVDDPVDNAQQHLAPTRKEERVEQQPLDAVAVAERLLAATIRAKASRKVAASVATALLRQVLD